MPVQCDRAIILMVEKRIELDWMKTMGNSRFCHIYFVGNGIICKINLWGMVKEGR